MIFWSYKLERFDLLASGGLAAAETALNQLGDEGWEFIAVQDIGENPFALFKRPVDTGEAAG
jgi:predicted Fe-Mo cluster-binding NifX family protein